MPFTCSSKFNFRLPAMQWLTNLRHLSEIRQKNSSCFNLTFLFVNQVLYIHTKYLAETFSSLSQTCFLPRLLHFPAVYDNLYICMKVIIKTP